MTEWIKDFIAFLIIATISSFIVALLITAKLAVVMTCLISMAVSSLYFFFSGNDKYRH